MVMGILQKGKKLIIYLIREVLKFFLSKKSAKLIYFN
jgi:hypothetical protein